MIVIGDDNRNYLKSIDFEEGVLEFTTHLKEALKYNDSWKPGVELDMLRFNFKNEYPQLMDMRVMEKYEDDSDYITSLTLDVETTVAGGPF
jgi:hypothetical protein